MSKAIMFLGTGSDVGKSIAATAFCRIFKKRGYAVVPFKAQNMSNNSYVTIEGGEIGRAQVAQAEAAGLIPSIHMNPILLKPSANQGSQIVLHGKAIGTMPAGEYYDLKPRLKKVIFESYSSLSREYDIIVMEGAGSCCEMNLKKSDIVNLPLAKSLNVPCILVADIDRGGVFAQIIGSHQLMTKKERHLTKGFFINKFRGYPELFESGIGYIEEKTSKPILGVIPFYTDIHIDSEDSVAVQADKRSVSPVIAKNVNIGVLRLPAISNFTDLEVLETEPDVTVNYISNPTELNRGYDCLILPGTKNVMEDAIWLRKSGWKKIITHFASSGKKILGICGGYQLLGKTIKDPYCVESNRVQVAGLNLLPIVTTLDKEKVLRKVSGKCLDNHKRIKGYEIHMGFGKIIKGIGEPFLRIHKQGERKSWQDGWSVNDGRISGTYVHGIFDSPGFRETFLNAIRKEKGLKLRSSRRRRKSKDKEYDRLAEHFEKNCDVERIIRIVSESV